MLNKIRSPRKTVYGLLTAGLLSASVLTSAIVALPPVQMAHAEAIAGLDATKSLSPLVEKVMPSVVSVEVKLGDKTTDTADNGGGMALGSGFVLTADGYVVTNNHVVADSTSVKVKFQNGDTYDATVIGTDAKTDLALLKIKSDKSFPHVNFATTEAKVGDYVMAVGNPFGLGGTVTQGIISARGRDIGNGPYDDFLQIDASINKGNSGGPTFNLEGDVVGINTAIYSPSGGSVGIGFAIPAATALNVIESLKTNHKVTRGWLGVQIQPVTADIADSLHLDGTKGALVSDLTARSPALKAGLKPGDTIIKVNGVEIADDRDLAKVIGKVSPGTDVKLAIIRDGKAETIAVTLGTMPTEAPQMANADQGEATPAEPLAAFGLAVEPAPNGKGVKITKIDPKSAAALSILKEGDTILKIGGADVSDQAAVDAALKKAGNKKVLLLVKTAQGQTFVTLDSTKG